MVGLLCVHVDDDGIVTGGDGPVFTKAKAYLYCALHVKQTNRDDFDFLKRHVLRHEESSIAA